MIGWSVQNLTNSDWEAPRVPRQSGLKCNLGVERVSDPILGDSLVVVDGVGTVDSLVLEGEKR